MKQLSLEAIRNSKERLPEDMTPIIRGLEKVSSTLTKQIAEWTSTPVQFEFKGWAKSQTGHAYYNPANDFQICHLLADAETETTLQIRQTQAFICNLCEIIFGGDAQEQGDQEDRPISSIERDVAFVFSQYVAKIIASTFCFPSSTEFRLRHLADSELEIKIKMQSPQIVASICAKLAAHEFEFEIDLPSKFISRASNTSGGLIASHRKKIAKWQDDFINVLGHADVNLTAVLAEIPIKLDQLGQLYIGQTLKLDVNLKSDMVVSTGDVKLFKTHLGQCNGQYGLVIDSQAPSK